MKIDMGVDRGDHGNPFIHDVRGGETSLFKNAMAGRGATKMDGRVRQQLVLGSDHDTIFLEDSTTGDGEEKGRWKMIDFSALLRANGGNIEIAAYKRKRCCLELVGWTDRQERNRGVTFDVIRRSDVTIGRRTTCLSVVGSFLLDHAAASHQETRDSVYHNESGVLEPFKMSAQQGQFNILRALVRKPRVAMQGGQGVFEEGAPLTKGRMMA
jgi:hypothetical protein